MFGWIIRHHTILSFGLYTAGFVAFVLTLKKGMYTYQFGQYAWTHMILMVRMVHRRSSLGVHAGPRRDARGPAPLTAVTPRPSQTTLRPPRPAPRRPSSSPRPSLCPTSLRV